MMDFFTLLLGLLSESLLRASLHGGIAIGLALLLETFWKTMPPAWRSWMWRLVFLKTAIALLPIIFSLPILPSTKLVESAPAALSVSQYHPVAANTLTANQTAFPWLSGLLVLIWLIGVVTCLCATRLESRKFQRRLNKARPIVDAMLLRTMRLLASKMKVTNPQLRISDSIASPCLSVLRKRPVLILPAKLLSGCTTSQIQIAMAHELAHFSRGDLAWNRFVSSCRTVMFFHPLIWIASRRYLTAQELACDAEALRHTLAPPARLAKLLVHFSRSPVTSSIGVVAMTGTYSRTRERIAAMFQFQKSPPHLLGWAFCVLGLVCLLPVDLSAQSTSTLREEDPAYSSGFGFQMSAGARAFSSASGSANGMSYGNRMGSRYGYGYPMQNGNAMANARARSQARAQAGVSISSNGFRPTYSQRPTDSYGRTQVPNRGSSMMQRSMSSAGTGQGGMWSRNTQSSMNGQTVTIEENQDQLSVTIERSDGTREKTVAANLQELSTKSPEAADLYRQLNQSTAANGAGANMMMNNMPNNWGAANPASRMLREQIETMRSQQGFQSQPMQNMFDSMLFQIP